MINEDKKLYSNTKQTKAKIKRCLLNLLSTKDLSQINITELVKCAGIYRATFYIHYRSLDNVILDMEKDVFVKYSKIKILMQNVDIYENIEEMISVVCEFIDEDKQYLKAIINTNRFNRVTLKLKDLLQEVILENFERYHHLKDNDNFRMTLSVVTGGIVFAYRDFIDRNSPNMKSLKEFLIKTARQLTCQEF